MDAKHGIMMSKKKGGWIREGIRMWKSKGRGKRGQYDVQIKRTDQKETAL